MSKLWLGLLPLGFVACEDGVGYGTGTTGDTGVEASAITGLTTEWTSNGVTVTISGGTAPFEFGMAQTGTNAGWFGEDCLEGQGTTMVCHTSDSQSFTLKSVASIGAVVEGQTTLFDQADDGGITYYAADDEGGCVTTGDDPSYYADCVEL